LRKGKIGRKAAQAGGNMHKILIVEDEKLIRKGIIYTFDWLSVDCTVIGEAANGAEGLEKIYELSPDIVITDVTMPRMDGLTMIEKSIDDCLYTAIIISAYDEFPLAKKAIKMGVDEYIIKPVDHVQLTEAIESAKVHLLQKRLYRIAQKSDQTFTEIELFSHNIAETVTSRRVIIMLDYIKNNYQNRISIHDLVDELDSSCSQLQKQFKHQTSYTFNDFLNRYRIQQAIHKLKCGNDKIYNIATEVGFSDYRYFITVFKKYTNYSPSQLLQYYRGTE